MATTIWLAEGADPHPQLIVASVRPSSVAAEGQFKSGDILLHLEGTEVKTPEDFNLTVAGFSGNSMLKVEVQRNQKRLYLYLRLPPSPPTPPEWLTVEQAAALVKHRYPKIVKPVTKVEWGQRREVNGGKPFYDVQFGSAGFRVDAKTGQEIDGYIK